MHGIIHRSTIGANEAFYPYLSNLYTFPNDRFIDREKWFFLYQERVNARRAFTADVEITNVVSPEARVEPDVSNKTKQSSCEIF